MRPSITGSCSALQTPWNARNRDPKPFPNSIQRMKLLATCVPPTLPQGDKRFAEKKKDCAFVCDRCKEIVHFSSFTKGTDPWRRNDCEFAGSYTDGTWSDIPAPLRRQAHDMRLINAIWTCTKFCGAEKTKGQRDPRNARTLAWTEEHRTHLRPYHPEHDSSGSSSHQPPEPKRQRWW